MRSAFRTDVGAENSFPFRTRNTVIFCTTFRSHCKVLKFVDVLPNSRKTQSAKIPFQLSLRFCFRLTPLSRLRVQVSFKTLKVHGNTDESEERSTCRWYAPDTRAFVLNFVFENACLAGLSSLLLVLQFLPASTKRKNAKKSSALNTCVHCFCCTVLRSPLYLVSLVISLIESFAF